MKKSLIKPFVIAIISIFGFTTLISAPIYAAEGDNDNPCKDICSESCKEVANEVKKAAGCPSTGGNTDELQTVISNILKSIIGVAGTISVIYIIIGGINYMTSTGDASKTEKAKKTILYACIGLIVCALAFVIVQFAIDTVANA